MADGEWGRVCSLLTAPMPTLRSRLLPAELVGEDGAEGPGVCVQVALPGIHLSLRVGESSTTREWKCCCIRPAHEVSRTHLNPYLSVKGHHHLFHNKSASLLVPS